MMAVKRVACSMFVAALAACGSASPRAASPAPTTPRSSTSTTVRTRAKVDPAAPEPKGAAVTLANRLADEAVLPPGAVRTSAPLPPELRGPWEVPAGVNLVSVRRVWSVPLDPDAVIAFLKTHAPAGLVEAGVGTTSSRTTKVMNVTETLVKLPSNTALAGLEIGVEAHGTGSLVDVVGGAQWTQVRPVDEHIGSRDRVVVVSEVPWSHDQAAGRRVVVTGPKRSAIVLAFDTQKVSAMGNVASNCFALGVNAVSYRVAFATSASAAPDVVATIAPCSEVQVRLGARRSLPLTMSEAFANAVAHALGESGLTFASSASK
jgi:hypothetical protein